MDYFETQDIPLGRTFTCEQFVEEFNAISDDYVADTYQGYVDIYDAESGVSGGFKVARLDPSACYWLFESERAYSWKEQMLMAKLAANPPMFRNPPKEREDD